MGFSLLDNYMRRAQLFPFSFFSPLGCVCGFRVGDALRRLPPSSRNRACISNRLQRALALVPSLRRRRPASARLLKVYSKRVCDQARAFLEMLRARCDCVLVCMCLRACVLCGERTLNPKAIELGGQGWVFDTSRRARGFRRGPVKQDREGPSVPKRLSLDTLNPKP